MTKYFFTGATSFLGSNLVNNLSKNLNNVIYCLVRKNSNNLNCIQKQNNIKLIYGDLLNIMDLNFFDDNIDYFFHFGWTGIGGLGRNNQQIQKENVEMSMNVLKFALLHKTKKFIFSGSQAEYGNSCTLKKETSLCNPVSFYGKAKLEFYNKASDFCAKHNMIYIHLRIFSVYGNGDHDTSLINSTIKSFINKTSIKYGPCTQLWNYLYIDDFVEIIKKIIEAKAIFNNNIINICSKEILPLKEYLFKIKRIIGYDKPLIFSEINPNPEGIANLNPSTDKLIAIIGNYDFISFEQGIKKMLEEMKYDNKRTNNGISKTIL